MIAWAPTRDQALERLNRALEQSEIRGVVTNIPFLSALLSHPELAANRIDTGFIERQLQHLTAEDAAPGDLEFAAAVAIILSDEAAAALSQPASPWLRAGWMPVGRRQRLFSFRPSHGAEQRVRLTYGKGPSTLSIGERSYVFASSSAVEGELDLTLDALTSRVFAVIEGHDLHVRTRHGRFDLHWLDPFGGEADDEVGDDRIVAPLPGTVVALLAEIGASLDKGAPILTLEVMKMEHTLRAPFAGVLKAIKCKLGDIVGEGTELAEIEPHPA
jgi:3-methylcrotonyl-CoA carboxylase alpha subunit